MQKIVIGALLVAALQGSSARAGESSTAAEALAESAGQSPSDTADAERADQDVAGSEDEPTEPVADEADSGEADEIVEKAGCGQNLHPKVRGGEAKWSLSCSGGRITISGWVKDTRADGKCAQVRVHLPNGDVHYSGRACPEGNTKHFSWSARGAIIDAYLIVT